MWFWSMPLMKEAMESMKPWMADLQLPSSAPVWEHLGSLMMSQENTAGSFLYGRPLTVLTLQQHITFQPTEVLVSSMVLKALKVQDPAFPHSVPCRVQCGMSRE